MELDTGQLNSVLSRALGSAFGGTYPRDLIPHRLRPYERGIMVNTDPHDKPGTLWVCLYVVPPVVEYFNSYGLKPFLPEILNFIDRHQCTTVWNPFDYQALNTTVCGKSCMYYLLQRHKRKKNGTRMDAAFSTLFSHASGLLHCPMVSRKVSPPCSSLRTKVSMFL